ncbi:hypothetical protein CY34DRAFT_89060 [Suillus luteus UH-Slu-Lm8-n1]|uniref:Anaphase-promoting complex subunit 5 n=1 Tax=Suillus luteus UH-Slu-Lm8-n1 TaxID=930992 RepID=A0A0C9ZPG0_9AGAM|nr:hypothetical protein CY34DRAFT_89060 [Suillus luteus UH-Slu-Lm8-n1]
MHRSPPRACIGSRRRFKQWSSIDDLDECTRCYRAAVSLCSEGHSERKTYLNSLTLVLYRRFNHQGNSDDLDEAISSLERSAALAP